MKNSPKTFVGKLIASVVDLFHKAEPIVDQLVHWAEDIVNVIKKAEASQAGQLLESGIESVFPVSVPLFNAFKLWLPRAASLIAGTSDHSDKTDHEKIEDLLDYLEILKTKDPVLYAGILNALNAAIQQFFTTNQGVDLPVSQSLVIAQLVHEPSLGSTMKLPNSR
jgi:hypothetical protein